MKLNDLKKQCDADPNSYFSCIKKSSWLIVGIVLILFSLALVHAGSIPFIGSSLVHFSPNLLLLGLILVIMFFLKKTRFGVMSKVLQFTLLFFVIGLNTRLPTIILDCFNESANQLNIQKKFTGQIGQPIHIQADVETISARMDTMDGVKPSCHGDECITTDGFRTLKQYVANDYWIERVKEVVLISGFSFAQQNEVAPTLRISKVQNGMQTWISFELKNETGESISSYQGRYRNGFALEADDGSVNSEYLKLEFLLHKNFAVSLVGLMSSNGITKPLGEFLSKVTDLIHPRGHQISLLSTQQSIKFESKNEISRLMKEVPLEIIDVKIHGLPEYKESNIESDLLLEVNQNRDCEKLLVPEVISVGTTETWYVFVNDPMRRSKVAYRSWILCGSNVIWFPNLVEGGNKIVIDKYVSSGNFMYSISFEVPAEVQNFSRNMHFKNPEFEDGYAYFEWLDTERDEQKNRKVRVVKARFKEPIL